MIAEEVRTMLPFLGHYSTEFDVKAKDLLCEVSDHVFFFFTFDYQDLLSLSTLSSLSTQSKWTFFYKFKEISCRFS